MNKFMFVIAILLSSSTLNADTIQQGKGYVINGGQTICTSQETLKSYLLALVSNNYSSMKYLVKKGECSIIPTSRVLHFGESYEIVDTAVMPDGDPVEFVKIAYPEKTLWVGRFSTNL